MKTITLDLRPFEEKISLHRYLKEQLDFPFYYGANLDALHDMLTSETQDLSIEILLPENPVGIMRNYLPRMRRVFEDSVVENYHIQVAFPKEKAAEENV